MGSLHDFHSTRSRRPDGSSIADPGMHYDQIAFFPGEERFRRRQSLIAELVETAENRR